MIADLYRSLRSAWKYFLREMRYRARKRKRAKLPDSFSPSYSLDQELREAYNKPFVFDSVKPKEQK